MEHQCDSPASPFVLPHDTRRSTLFHARARRQSRRRGALISHPAMGTPRRQQQGLEEGYDGGKQAWSGSKGPSPAKARQSHRRYRALFHQAAKEYRAWCEGEDDSQRALGSVFHLLDRLRMLKPDQSTDTGVHLGGLEYLPDCRTLLIRKHTTEVERVMRLWRALVQQMRGQVSRVEEFLGEAWQSYRSESRARPALLPPTSPSLLPPPPLVATQRSPGQAASGARSRLNAESLMMAPPAPSSSEPSPSGRIVAHARGGDPEGVSSRAEAVVVEGVAAVGAPEYLQWLGDMSNMLVHEQWRKEELLSRVDFGPEASSERVRAFVQARWSSRSADSFLDRAMIDTSLTAAQVPPAPKAR